MTPMPIPKAVFLDAGTLDGGDLDWQPLKDALPDLVCHDHTSPEARIERLRDQDIVITNKVPLDRNTLQAAERLRLICVAATGTDHIDIGAAPERGITVCNVRDYATPSVVQHTLALILALRARLMDWREAVHGGRWSASPHFSLLRPGIEELAGQALGIVGYGTLGQAVARAAEAALGMRILISERPGRERTRPGRLPFETVLAEADVLSLHLPLAPDTRHLMNADTLAQMKPGALLVNTARGGLVEPLALLQALDQGHLGGAALDVLEPEPPPHDHPLLRHPRPNLIITPHVAWASRAARQRLLEQLARIVRAWQAGAPINEVIP